MPEKLKSLSLGLAFVSIGLFVSKGLSGHHGEKPVALRSCALSGCHQPAPAELRGNLISISQRAELVQIDTGVTWNVKFDENTKIVGWNQPLNKLGRGTPIKIVYTKKGEDLYATLISVKPPLSVPPEKLVKVDEMKRIWEEKKAVIIDARPPAKYQEGYIPGAINIPFAEMDKHLDKMPKDKDALIITYCEGPR